LTLFACVKVPRIERLRSLRSELVFFVSFLAISSCVRPSPSQSRHGRFFSDDLCAPRDLPTELGAVLLLPIPFRRLPPQPPLWSVGKPLPRLAVTQLFPLGGATVLDSFPLLPCFTLSEAPPLESLLSPHVCGLRAVFSSLPFLPLSLVEISRDPHNIKNEK